MNPDQTPTPATRPTIDPDGLLRTAETNTISAGDAMLLAAQQAGHASARLWLLAAALRIRRTLPTAHQMVVDTSAWLDDRGTHRPDITEVYDHADVKLFDYKTAEQNIGDEILEACTLLDQGLLFADPWNIDTGWEPIESRYGPSYRVTLPELPPEIEAACRQLAAEGRS